MNITQNKALNSCRINHNEHVNSNYHCNNNASFYAWICESANWETGEIEISGLETKSGNPILLNIEILRGL